MMKDNRKHIFVIGSARSGTTLITSIISKSSQIANYPAETKILECKTRYGDLMSKDNRKAFLDDWFNSRQYKRSGLSKHEFLGIFDRSSSNYSNLLSSFMNLVAEKQGKNLWIDSTPGYVFYLEEISNQFPNSKIIHMIRDGRAVALSLAKLGWSGSATSSFDKAIISASLKWQKSVTTAKQASLFLNNRYYELRYEDFVIDPINEVRKLSTFIELPDLPINFSQQFDYSNNDTASPLRNANTAFGDMGTGISATAATRWKNLLTSDQISIIESCVGKTLCDFGYNLCGANNNTTKYFLECRLSKYKQNLKRHLKEYSRLGHFSQSPLEIGKE